MIFNDVNDHSLYIKTFDLRVLDITEVSRNEDDDMTTVKYGGGAITNIPLCSESHEEFCKEIQKRIDNTPSALRDAARQQNTQLQQQITRTTTTQEAQPPGTRAIKLEED